MPKRKPGALLFRVLEFSQQGAKVVESVTYPTRFIKGSFIFLSQLKKSPSLYYEQESLKTQDIANKIVLKSCRVGGEKLLKE